VEAGYWSTGHMWEVEEVYRVRWRAVFPQCLAVSILFGKQYSVNRKVS
jgi:hypothetical protein